MRRLKKIICLSITFLLILCLAVQWKILVKAGEPSHIRIFENEIKDNLAESEMTKEAERQTEKEKDKNKKDTLPPVITKLIVENNQEDNIYMDTVIIEFEAMDTIDESEDALQQEDKRAMSTGIESVEYKGYLNGDFVEEWSGKIDAKGDMIVDESDSEELKHQDIVGDSDISFSGTFDIPYDYLISMGPTAENQVHLVEVELWATDSAGNVSEVKSLAFKYQVDSLGQVETEILETQEASETIEIEIQDESEGRTDGTQGELETRETKTQDKSQIIKEVQDESKVEPTEAYDEAIIDSMEGENYPSDKDMEDNHVGSNYSQMDSDSNLKNNVGSDVNQLTKSDKDSITKQKEATVSFSLVNMRHPEEEIDVPYSVVEKEEGQEVIFESHVPTKEMDGLYVLTTTTTDEMGNITEEEKTFSVNNFGAYYILSDETRKLVDSYYTNQEQDIVITEYSVTEIRDEDSKVYYTKDGETIYLEQEKDYTRTLTQNDGWNEYTYKIKAANFATEGYYDVAIESEDISGNKMTNKLNKYTKDNMKYHADIRFIVDKTSPIVSIDDLDKYYYKEVSHQAKITVLDNTVVASVDVYSIEADKDYNYRRNTFNLYAECITHYDNLTMTDVGESFNQLDGELPFEIKSSNHPQKLVVVVKDAAGNQTFSQEYQVLVSDSLLVAFMQNKILCISVVVMIILLSIVMKMLIKRFF